MKAETKQFKRSRWYPCPKCGKDHPSVTTLLDVMASPALMGWMGKNGTAKLNTLAGVIEPWFGSNGGAEEWETLKKNAEARWKLTEDTAFWKSGYETGKEASDYGMLAHAWVESDLKGVGVDLGALPQPARNACEAYLAWKKEHHLETIETEHTFYNCRLHYAGTADWIGKLDGELSVGDWKTSSGIYFNHIIQGWSYALADETENAARLYGQIFIGRFGKDGTPEVKLYKRNQFPSIETAREVIQGCGAIFAAQQEYDRRFPYVKPTKKQEAAT